MICSKRSSLLLVSILAVNTGCQSTSAFRIKQVGEKLSVIEADRERIVQECYFMNASDENNWRHQYMLHVLNEKNEVIPIFFPTNQGKKECSEFLRKVDNILKASRRVKLCVRKSLERMVDEGPPEDPVDFGKLGKHDSPYYALTFDSICNSKECFSISDRWSYTCPKE
jgi:hypothetical protein